MTRVALMAAVTAVSAQITVPLPFTPVPFTLQVVAVILSGLLLGWRAGALAQAVYLVVGAIGVPVFAGFSGGLGPILGPTGGYLLSYPVAAALAGLAARSAAGPARGKALRNSLLTGTLALAAIYAAGASWLAAVAHLSPATALVQGVLPFVPFDLAKVFLAALTATAAAPAIAGSRT